MPFEAEVGITCPIVSTFFILILFNFLGSPSERSDNYYDERDEELLNRIEDILGVDCLHYLDDMFTLLTLQQ